MLTDRQLVTCKHTFADDMESLLYVVLYCALLWQPHNLSRQELTKFVVEFFEESQRVDDVDTGGSGKSANALSRTYTGSLQLGSKALQEWLITVVNFCWPPQDQEEYQDKWNADHLDTYWATFLQTHTLERDNRVVHTMDTPIFRPSSTPFTAYSPWSPSSFAAQISTPPSARSKRPSPGFSAENSRAKRVRMSSSSVQPTMQARVTRSKTKAAFDPSTLRRSTRLRGKQARHAQAPGSESNSRRPPPAPKPRPSRSKRRRAASRD